MRLSTLAANVVAEYLHSQDERVLCAYSGDLFRARFTSRLWMRRIAAAVRHRELIELGCATLRLPIFNRLAWEVFFGRGSFPDVNFESLREVAVGAEYPPLSVAMDRKQGF